jgi:hypothetical protein
MLFTPLNDDFIVFSEILCLFHQVIEKYTVRSLRYQYSDLFWGQSQSKILLKPMNYEKHPVQIPDLFGTISTFSFNEGAG